MHVKEGTVNQLWYVLVVQNSFTYFIWGLVTCYMKKITGLAAVHVLNSEHSNFDLLNKSPCIGITHTLAQIYRMRTSARGQFSENVCLFSLRCPGQECKVGLPVDIVQDVLGEEEYKRWERLQLQVNSGCNI